MNKIVCILALAAFCSAVPLEVNQPTNRISNGNFADNLEFPYAVSFQQINDVEATRGHRCGGALVTLQFVVTAASCMYEWNADGSRNPINSNNYRVFAGASLLTNTTADRIRTIYQYFVHPDYLGIPSYANDIAVVNLTTPFLNTTVVPIALPLATHNPADFTLCRVAGWGATSNNPTVLASTELRYASKYIYNQNLCSTVYNTQYGMPNIMPSMVCAASFDIISSGCVSDDGNALVCDNVFTGVMALHGNCGASSYPELYTRVSNYTVWIRSITDSASTFTPGASVLIFLTLIQVAYTTLIS